LKPSRQRAELTAVARELAIAETACTVRDNAIVNLLNERDAARTELEQVAKERDEAIRAGRVDAHSADVYLSVVLDDEKEIASARAQLATATRERDQYASDLTNMMKVAKLWHGKCMEARKVAAKLEALAPDDDGRTRWWCSECGGTIDYKNGQWTCQRCGK